MKRALIILMGGLLLALAAYGGIYFACVTPNRELLRSQTPELAWLKTEFKVSDTEYQRIVGLHATYRSQCMERCQLIAKKNEEFKNLVAKEQTITPEIETNLAESAQIRLECQKAMLKHCLEVSQSMPPEQGRRYLAWVQENTCLDGHGMEMK
jgi:hypothetical protein